MMTKHFRGALHVATPLLALLFACAPKEMEGEPAAPARGGSSGSGGARSGGAGPASGGSGAGGSGGATSSGGATGSGGAVGSGGTTGSGGAPGTGGSTAGAGGAGGNAGTGGSSGADAGATPEAGGTPGEGVALTGKVAKTLFKISISQLVGNRTSGNIPAEQENQRNEDTFAGDASKTYDVTFRVRGLVEPRIYQGGMADPASPWIQVGGMPSTTSAEHGRQYGVFKIEVSDPMQVYFLNKDQMLKDHELYKLDYKIKVKAKGGAKISVVFADAPRSGAIANHRNMVVENFPEDVVKQPFKDQFMYVEADAVAPSN